MKVGDIFGNYRVTKRIGKGGMGEVWKAEHIHLENRFIAIKVLLHQDVKDDPEIDQKILQQLVAGLNKEAHAASSVESDHIIKIEDIQQNSDGEVFLVMEFLNGKTFSKVLKQEKQLVPLIISSSGVFLLMG